MKTFTYEIKIQAGSEDEADSKMKAVTILVSRLTDIVLTKLAHVVQHDPVKTAIAKKALGV